MTGDPFDLARFVRAQADSFDDALAELRAGLKRSHWMWFVFPQLRGLGRSETARFYGIESADEARAYLAHPILGRRLTDCCAAMLCHAGIEAETILGPVDALKLRSSMTLFEAVADESAAYAAVLDVFFDMRDDATLALLRQDGTRGGVTGLSSSNRWRPS